ncbi:class I SAM-dependent methyltransferase [Streptomonospora arabica]|uniref:Class I SAM-dependent methyltransferase n=1 Tax=Streptomonospora arabica TaxID=412417 RepID=A0ABV9SK92_9ACTN
MSAHPPASPEPAPGSATASAAPDPRVWSRRNMARLYDLLVIHGTYRWLWGCPQQRVAALYAAAIQAGDRVLEVGPGAGYFLDRIGRADLDVHLLDINDGPLHTTATRLARYRPATHLHNAVQPFPLEENSIDVAVLSMVLHCLPGSSIAEKTPVLDHIATVVRPGGAFIGATVLSSGVDTSSVGRTGSRYLNAKGIFHNSGDSLTDLTRVLHERFADVRLGVCGSVALWRVSTR